MEIISKTEGVKVYDFRWRNFLSKYHLNKEEIIKNGIVLDTLEEIYKDFNMYKETYETQAELIRFSTYFFVTEEFSNHNI